MKQLTLLIAALFALLSGLSAQITQEEADSFVLELMSQKGLIPYIVYAKEGLQTEMTITTTYYEEEIELDYPCWVYYSKRWFQYQPGLVAPAPPRESGHYLVVNAANGNLLEVKTWDDPGPAPSETWRLLEQTGNQLTGYIVGFEPCLLRRYVVISEDLKDTLMLHKLPEEITDSLFAGIDFDFSPCYRNVSFPETYRDSFKIRLNYTVTPRAMGDSSDIFKPCPLVNCPPMVDYTNYVPVIADSAVMIDTNSELIRQIREKAVDTLTVGSDSLVLDAYLHRDFMPVSPPGGRLMSSTNILISIDSTKIPDNISMVKQYVIYEDEIWVTDYEDETLPNMPEYKMRRISINGPKWLGYVDVISQIHDSQNNKDYYIQKKNVWIQTSM